MRRLPNHRTLQPPPLYPHRLMPDTTRLKERLRSSGPYIASIVLSAAAHTDTGGQRKQRRMECEV